MAGMNTHVTVLEREAIEGLALQKGMTVVDATLGSGGHTRSILKKIGKNGTLIAIDADRTAIEALKSTLPKNAHLVNANFKELHRVLCDLNIKEVDAILADLGWRMEQFAEGKKGFSFVIDEPLLMTYGDPADYPFVARDIVNEWEEDSIVNVLRGYGEERFARRIAKKIVAMRAERPIESSGQLAAIVESAVPGSYKRGRVHPATRTFQALRIAVNDELQVLEAFIHSAVSHLQEHGRLAIITFHSIEDRIVKQAFRSLAKEGLGTLITKKPITPTKEELTANPRARSAKLRIFQKETTYDTHTHKSTSVYRSA